MKSIFFQLAMLVIVAVAFIPAPTLFGAFCVGFITAMIFVAVIEVIREFRRW